MADTQAITLRMPVDVYERLRRESYKTRTPMNTLILRALTAVPGPETKP